jgi:hypothetical protein
MSDNMHDLRGWAPVTCVASDAIRSNKRPVSSLTDLSGTYGTPVVYTEWADADRPVLRDYRWPDSERDCAHYVPDAGDQS